MDTIDAHTTTHDGGEMTPHKDDIDAASWRRIDDVGYAHHVVVWMIILELEQEETHPINIPTIQRRMFRWTGQYPTDDRVDTSVKRLNQHDIIEREEVDEWPGGKHNFTTTDGYEIARQIAIKWLHLLDCEDRTDLREIDPEAEAAADGGEDGDEDGDGDGE